MGLVAWSWGRPKCRNSIGFNELREPGFEPGRVSPQDPKSCASANSATRASLFRPVYHQPSIRGLVRHRSGVSVHTPKPRTTRRVPAHVRSLQTRDPDCGRVPVVLVYRPASAQAMPAKRRTRLPTPPQVGCTTRRSSATRGSRGTPIARVLGRMKGGGCVPGGDPGKERPGL